MSACSGAISGTNGYPCSELTALECAATSCCVYSKGACTARLCSVFTNPDICTGCTTCTGNWTIDDVRGWAPATGDIIVTGQLIMSNGGSLTVGSASAPPIAGTLACNDISLASTSTISLKKGTITVT